MSLAACFFMVVWEVGRIKKLSHRKGESINHSLRQPEIAV